MAYSSNYENRASIFDSGDVIEGDHFKSLYDELGPSPGSILKAVGVPYKAGAWFNPSRTISDSPTTRVNPAGTLELSPLVLGQTISFDRIGTYVTAAGSTDTVIRLGIYNANTDGSPSTLVSGSEVTQDGEVVNTATPGGEVISVTLGPGRYYLGGVNQGTGTMPTTYSGGASYYSVPLESTSFTELVATTTVAIAVTGITGALPADLSSSTLRVRGSVVSLAVRMV
jgi:hypothetical protein